MRLHGEIGNDLSLFPTVKHFTSWLGLAPGLRKSGKSNKASRHRPKTHAGQIFREIAQSLLISKNHALGAFGRRIRARKGPAVAIKALARKVAVLFYFAITKGLDYVEQGVKAYQEQYKAQQIYFIEKVAKKHGYQLVMTPELLIQT